MSDVKIRLQGKIEDNLNACGIIDLQISTPASVVPRRGLEPPRAEAH